MSTNEQTFLNTQINSRRRGRSRSQEKQKKTTLIFQHEMLNVIFLRLSFWNIFFSLKC